MSGSLFVFTRSLGSPDGRLGQSISVAAADRAAADRLVAAHLDEIRATLPSEGLGDQEPAFSVQEMALDRERVVSSYFTRSPGPAPAVRPA